MATNHDYQMSETTKQILIVLGFFTTVAVVTYFIFSN